MTGEELDELMDAAMQEHDAAHGAGAYDKLPYTERLRIALALPSQGQP